MTIGIEPNLLFASVLWTAMSMRIPYAVLGPKLVIFLGLQRQYPKMKR